jgi:hypothetical protein
MSNELIQIVSSQGIWTLLSFILIYYIIQTQEKRDKNQEERESKYQDIISDLTTKLELLDVINSDIRDIKNNLKV